MNQLQRDAKRNARQAQGRAGRGGLKGLHRVSAEEIGLMRGTVKVPRSNMMAYQGTVAPSAEQLAMMRTETYYGPSREIGFDDGRLPFDASEAPHDGRNWLGRMMERVAAGV